MEYKISIPDTDVIKLQKVETFCKDNHIQLQVRDVDYVDLGTNKNEIKDLVEHILTSDTGVEIDLTKKYFGVEDMATEILSLTDSAITDKLNFTYQEIAENVLLDAMDSFALRGKRLQQLEEYAKEHPMAKEEYLPCYLERFIGTEPLVESFSYLIDKVEWPYRAASCLEVVASNAIRNGGENAETYEQYLKHNFMDRMDRFEEQITASLYTAEEKKTLKDTLIQPLPKNPKGKRQAIPGAYQALRHYAGKLQDIFTRLAGSPKSAEDFKEFVSHAYHLTVDTAKKHPDISIFQEAADLIKESATQLISYDKGMDIAISTKNYKAKGRFESMKKSL